MAPARAVVQGLWAGVWTTSPSARRRATGRHDPPALSAWRHTQQSLRFRCRDKNGQWRGGARDGAGRPKVKRWASEHHKARPRLSGREAVLVTVRTVGELGTLRRWRVYHAFRRALATSLAHLEFRVVHLSIQRTHVHLIADAADHEALARGMQGLLISAARRINRAFARQHGRVRRGAVFPDRYHERVLSSPRQCRNAICYVLNNFRLARARADHRFEPPPDYDPLPTNLPETWLLAVGWQRHGLIGTREVPGPVDRV